MPNIVSTSRSESVCASKGAKWLTLSATTYLVARIPHRSMAAMTARTTMLMVASKGLKLSRCSKIQFARASAFTIGASLSRSSAEISASSNGDVAPPPCMCTTLYVHRLVHAPPYMWITAQFAGCGGHPRTPLKSQDSYRGYQPPFVCTALCVHRLLHSRAPPNRGGHNQNRQPDACLLGNPKEGGNARRGSRVPNPNSRGHTIKRGLRVPNSNSRGHTTKRGLRVPNPNSKGHATKRGLRVANPNSRGHATKRGLRVPNPNLRGHTTKRGLRVPNPNSRGHTTKRGLGVPNPNSRGHATKRGLRVPNPNLRGHATKRGL